MQNRNPNSQKIQGGQQKKFELAFPPTFQQNLLVETNSARGHEQQRGGSQRNLMMREAYTDRQKSPISTRNPLGFLHIKKDLNSASQGWLQHQKEINDEKFKLYKSIVGNLSDQEVVDTLHESTDYFKGIIWRRPDDIYGRGNYQLFQDKIEPNDIQQGQLGDCYFLCALAALAEKPERIKKIFEDQVVNNKGTYKVKFYHMGIWQEVTVNDLFPCDPDTKQPQFIRSNGNELWVLILQKVWAKLCGSYAETVSGFPGEVFHEVTGAPTVTYWTKDSNLKEKILDDIFIGERRDYVMACGTPSKETMKELEDKYKTETNIEPGHAYSLLAAYKIKVKGKWIYLVKLRNPWGEKEWKGPWSDGSPEWTPELMKELKVEDLEDGIFFMQYEDLLKYFSYVQICKVDDNFAYESLLIKCEDQHPLFTTFDFNFEITVKQAGLYYFTINQENKRGHAEGKTYKYSPVSIALHRIIEKETSAIIQGTQKTEKEVWVSDFLNQGTYLIRVKIDWNQRRGRDFSISSYGEGNVKIQEAGPRFIQKEIMSKDHHQQPIQYQSQSQPQEFNSYQKRREHLNNQPGKLRRNEVQTFHENQRKDLNSSDVTDSCFSHGGKLGGNQNYHHSHNIHLNYGEQHLSNNSYLNQNQSQEYLQPQPPNEMYPVKKKSEPKYYDWQSNSFVYL